MSTRITTAQSLHLVRLLTAETLTQDGVVIRSGLNKVQIARWIKRNRDNVRVADWAPDKNGRLFVPMWQWGVGADVERPGPKQSDYERVKAWRAKKKLEKEGGVK